MQDDPNIQAAWPYRLATSIGGLYACNNEGTKTWLVELYIRINAQVLPNHILDSNSSLGPPKKVAWSAGNFCFGFSVSGLGF